MAPHVKRIVGIDSSLNIIEHFKKAYTHIESRVVDCRQLDQESDLTTGSSDKLFLNAAALKPGGLLVNESGALGNVAGVHSGIIGGLFTRGGLTWVKGEVQLRQTTLTENEKGGVEGWIGLFSEPFLELPPTTEARDAAVKHAVDVLEAVGRKQHDGSLTANYTCLRFVAQKPE
ncbi:S-adenosyl-L-methionine-dependent methyltransferase [Penicillium samsonianum]|uniref:S-adenosyl-L-methionine-dependent methyltransferase n=1 Tax=Penicillium samsonianum TaxID=1882272 RepID=UPI0025499A94|nr:S-adenosyl-L-methionine-dependent methyltransferase [Penicillium samsonianum]KAJ6140360.1 S-adenosyl-L-methionine-dependent methyltransferase [Penicillium samsonianum]